jgi:uncharacterized membrane protein (DUF373 family)
MSAEKTHGKTPGWEASVEKFEGIVVAVLAFLLVVIVLVILVVVAYLFLSKMGEFVTSVESIAEVQQTALRAFSGVLLVLLGLELLDTVKVYFREHNVRVEVILLVALIAMGRHVLEIDLHHINPLTLFGFSSLVLALAISYFLVKRAQISVIGKKPPGREELCEILTEK